MRIEVLHIDECPNWREAGSRLEAALDTLRLTASVEYRLLQDSEEAASTPFAGSPTIVVDGSDLFPVDARSPELACRVYLTPSGLRGVPETGQLVEALERRGDNGRH